MGHTNMDGILLGCLLAMVDHLPAARERLSRALTPGRAAVVLGILVVNLALGQRFRGIYTLPIGWSV
jgi:hypothetical protein